MSTAAVTAVEFQLLHCDYYDLSIGQCARWQQCLRLLITAGSLQVKYNGALLTYRTSIVVAKQGAQHYGDRPVIFPVRSNKLI